VAAVEVIVPQRKPRLWHRVLIARLRAAGHAVSVLHQPDAATWPPLMVHALGLERRIFRRSEPCLAAITSEIAQVPRSGTPSVRLDLAGLAANTQEPTLRLAFDGTYSDAAVPIALAGGRLPEIQAVVDNQFVVGSASPMVDKRESAALGAEDVLARAITLALVVVAGLENGSVTTAGGTTFPRQAASTATDRRFLTSYLGSALPRLGGEALRRMRFRYAHWRVGYRFNDAAGVAETGRLGTGWSELPDPGDHFYADPFAFEWRGESFIFVEDYSHATKKAAISVVTFDDRGAPQPPQPVLERDFHLSYPQVFARDGEIWMLPEACSSGKLTLYRAARFPDQWTAETELIDGREISDATLLEHGGRWWLFATERDGFGSTSDTMAVFHSPALMGPWTPHRANPVLIDRRAARPGGAFVPVAGKLFLPVQDGTKGYGGGLGLAEILRLDEDWVQMSSPHPVSAIGDWPYPQIHTLNRAGRLEVIDGIAAMPRRPTAEVSSHTRRT
jgi:hypothetical protein